MKYLKQKFSDSNNNIDSFLTSNNCLLNLENNNKILESAKIDFVERFIKKLLDDKIITDAFIKSVDNTNAWSVDFPSWNGEFNEERGKKIFIIGSEPHIHHKYLQTVYGFNNEKKLTEYINHSHPIFKFISDLLSHKLKISEEEVLKECYLTDLFPLSPFRVNGISVGSTDKLQLILNETANWKDIRHKYAKENLPIEISNVMPEIIITQGKIVFEEVIKILGIKSSVNKIKISSTKGKNQFIRSVKWNEIEIISVPHIGSKRMRTFWTNDMPKVKEAIMEV